jgi:DNA-binding response OmpR family regulator
VLVAEDHDDTRYLLRTLLERRGFAVIEAADGEEACDVAERERPDLILMDGGLPVLDGVSATRRMRGLDALSDVPIVFLSGHAGPQDQSDARDAGCDEYVVKPFDLAILDNILERLLRARGERQNEVSQTSMSNISLSGAPRPEGARAQKMYGLVELDQAGTVLYTRFEGDGAATFSARDFTGLNFYTQVAPFQNVGEFRQRLDDFSKGTLAAHSMDFTCVYADGPLPVRVLLARIRERSQHDATKSILVHFRSAQQSRAVSRGAATSSD